MSSKIKGLRRVGIVGLSTAVVASMMTLTAATSFAAADAFIAVDQLDVSQGQVAAPAGDLTLEIANDWATSAAQTFTIVGNNCSSAAGIAAAVEFSAAPTVTVTDPGTANAALDTTPILSPAVLGSTTATPCAAAGITDQVTITQTLPATGTASDTFLVTLSNIKYNVGASKTATDIEVVTAGGLAAGSTVSNATVPVASFFNTPARVAALSSAPGVTSLGTQTLSEGAAGEFFTTAPKTITLHLSTGLFTANVTPTITATAGYVIAKAATSAASDYTFTVTGPATPVRAVVTVSGLTTTPTVGIKIVTLTAGNGTVTLGPVKAINVVNYGERTGGALRYDTAAALFNGNPGFDAVTNVVLSGGALFPDALSANYLAGKLGTGTLLTTPASLSNAARLAILAHPITTVYITGGFGAVSQAVQNQIEAMHVGNLPNGAFITTVRLGGSTRYETNRLVNEHNFTASNTVILASGGGFSRTQGFADALAMGPVAYHLNYPLIITSGGPTATLSTNENTQLSDFNPTNVIIAGGTGVVSAAIEASLKADGKTVLRLGGQDRTQTAAAIAKWATVGVTGAAAGSLGASRGFYSGTTYVTTGSEFADALAAGPVAGSLNRMIVLSTTPTVLGAGIPLYLGEKNVGTVATNGTSVGTLWALGLTGATSNGLMKAAAATIEVP